MYFPVILFKRQRFIMSDMNISVISDDGVSDPVVAV